MSETNGAPAKNSFQLALKKIFIKDSARFTIAAFITLLYLIFQVYRTFLYPLPPMLLRPIHIASVCVLCLLYAPFKLKAGSKRLRTFTDVLDIVGIVVGFCIIVFFICNYEYLIRRLNYLDPVRSIDHVICICLIVLLIICTYRTVGKSLPIFEIVFIAYGWVAPYLPGILHYEGFSLDKFTSLMVLGNEGIFGTASGAASGFLFWMMLFGGLFGAGSGGDTLIDIGMKAGAKSKDNSAPAKAAVISSGLFGMISGSASANVAATGVFTIPLMKKAGYSPEEAGAVEAVASTGGQIMPPIMGTAAFLMADMLDINYVKIAGAAVIPGLIYYIAVFILVHLLAKKRASMGGTVGGYIHQCERILPRLIYLLPVVTLIITIGLGYTIQRGALNSILTVLVLNFLGPKKYRKPVVTLFNEVMVSTKRVATVGMPLCGCGIIIGIISMTGLANRLSSVISSVGSQYLWIGLVITMLGCILLGMGMPTVAAYLTAYVLFIPTLRGLGIPSLAANLFIFYFGIFAQITPPVCVASYTAAGIAGGNSWNTGWKAFTFALCAFLTPYVFVFKPGIMLMGSVGEIVSSIVIVLSGTVLLTMGIAGYLFRPMSKLIRILFALAGVLICIPEIYTTYAGYVMGVILLAIEFYNMMKKRKVKTLA